jgi:protein involved in polysaccharide export with SLBB domain
MPVSSGQPLEGLIGPATPATPPGAPTGPPQPTAGAPPARFPAPGFPGVDCVPIPGAEAVAPAEEPLSAIEGTFEAPVVPGVKRRLRQFGYDIFRIPASTFAPVEDVPVGPEYVLGPGDSLIVYVWGLVESVFTETINRNGEIFIPKAGTLRVWGLSFERAEQLIRDQLSRVYTGFRISVTLGRLRTIRVFVVGEVTRPGAYTLSALSTLTNALFVAGGPSKQGTLRRIGVLRNNKVVSEMDFYDFLLRGDKSQDVRLESGDTVFVPSIGPTVGLVGNVNRPAIYELKGETQVTDVLAMAGGVSPSGFLQRLQLERFRANTERVVQDFNLLDFTQRGQQSANPFLRDGDLVRVFPVDPRIYNAVTLEGPVKRPGTYELRPGMRLGELVVRDELLPEAYLDRAEVVRVKEDLSAEVIPFSVRELWAGQAAANLELRPLDRVVISSEFRPAATVAVSGLVKRPGRYVMSRGERLSSLLERAGGLLPDAFPKGAVFTRESIRRIEREQLDRFIRTQEQALLAESAAVTAASTELSTADRGETTTAQAAVTAQRRELLRLLAASVTLGRLAIHVESPEKLKGSPDDILLEDGDSLFIPQQPTSVAILGAVRNSTAVLHKEKENIEYYVNRAGGPTREADVDEIYIIKADGSALSSFVPLRHVEAGDTIVVPISTEPRIRTLPLLKDIATIVAGFAVPVGVIAAIAK